MIKGADEPHVTIQICTCNEANVIEGTIDAACSVDWPSNKLTVQVLDDSTEDKERLVVREPINHWKMKGINAQHLTRPDRPGTSFCYDIVYGFTMSPALFSVNSKLIHTLSFHFCSIYTGYKAGNLKYHQGEIDGDFVAFFDSGKSFTIICMIIVVLSIICSEV